MAYTWERKTGKAARSYYHSDREILCEGDEDGDGFWETMILLDQHHMPAEVFHRLRNGSVRPASTNTIARLRRTYSFGNKYVAPFIEAIKDSSPASKQADQDVDK